MADGAGDKSKVETIRPSAPIWVEVRRRTHDPNLTRMLGCPGPVRTGSGRSAPRRFDTHSSPWVMSRRLTEAGLRTPVEVRQEPARSSHPLKKRGSCRHSRPVPDVGIDQ